VKKVSDEDKKNYIHNRPKLILAEIFRKCTVHKAKFNPAKILKSSYGSNTHKVQPEKLSWKAPR